MRIRVVDVTYLDKEEINEYQFKCYPSTVDDLKLSVMPITHG